jgi:hypothetical protein
MVGKVLAEEVLALPYGEGRATRDGWRCPHE